MLTKRLMRSYPAIYKLGRPSPPLQSEIGEVLLERAGRLAD
jgi:hypothetical protein